MTNKTTKETMTKNKMEKLVAYVQARVLVADQYDQNSIRVLKYGIDDILKLANVEIDQSKEGSFYMEFAQKLKQDKSFKPKGLEKSLPFSLLFNN